MLTVGAFSHGGTLARADDTVAAYSSRGPSAIDYAAKPDIVAPGTGVVSLSDPSSLLYQTMFAYTVDGSVSTSYKPYLSLSGTSMAAPVVSGTVALMMQANPRLTPNLVKAILQYTAQAYRAVRPADPGGGVPGHQGRGRSRALLRDGTRRRPLPGRLHVEPPYPVGEPPASARRPQSVWHRVAAGRRLGRSQRPVGRQHRVGDQVLGRYVLQHRVGNVPQRRRQRRVGNGQHRVGHEHRLGHRDRWLQHRLGHRG